MPYYAPSAYYPLPGILCSAPRGAAPPPLQQQQQLQQQYTAPAPQIEQAYLRQQAETQAQQQLAYQQQQLQQQQYIEQQNRHLAQQQYYQQQQYAAQQQRLQQQQYAQQQQQYAQQQQLQQQAAVVTRQQQRSGYQSAPASPASPLYKSSEYVQPGGVYSTGGAYNQPSLRRIPSRADVNTAIENQEAPYQSFGQGLNSEKQRGLVTSYNPYANYGQGSVIQSPIRPQGSSQREPSEYACDALNPIYRQQQQQTYSQGNPTELGARSLNAPTTIVLDGNNNAAPAPLPARSPARGYGSQQRGYGTGAQAESAYIGIPNDLVYAQTNQQRAYNYPQESRQAYASSSRTNQASPSTPSKLNPTVARELFAALSSENVRTAVDRDALISIQSCPAYSTYNGQKVSGRAFAIPADQKYSEYNFEDLNGLRSVIDR
ncbi:hypothetical protein PRIPAC_72000 [Pristionchus pacificus]|nr:hypothetical protein PRIPAC_72000 [Pristionchus pacificus]